MFRAQPNIFDDLVAKATDENLTSEPWGEIMNVCDKVNDSETGARDAVQALIKRLNHRNANVQLYALELANALSQNCGIKLHRELASKSFTEALLRLANERNTHQRVKAKILERMSDWAEMFSSNAELGIMEQNYMKLKAQNPNLQPPSQPPKTLITDSDRRREEEELQMALALSIKEKDRVETSQKPSVAASSSGSPGPSQSSQPTPQPMPTGTTAATVSRVRALYDFNPTETGELQFRKGDIISVVESVYKDWWRGSLHGQTGIFPLNYVEKLQDPTKEELEREAQMEAEVFAEIKNVEKLLALLSTSAESGKGDVRDNDEITTLYHSTLAIRPKLIELIAKYSQKKDDFTHLNEKFIKARRDYEGLIEASMSQPPQGYGRPSYPSYPSGGQGGYGGGYAQQNPQSYYSQGQSESQQPPYQQANGPQPFYFIPPSQQGSQQQQQQQPQSQPQLQQQQQSQPQPQSQHSYPTNQENNSTDDLYSAPPRTSTSQRPHSLAYDPRLQQQQGAGPSELASTSFDSPVNDGRPGYGQQTAGATGQQRPSSPYTPSAATKPQGMYAQQSQSQGRLPSDPYSWNATQSQGRPPSSSSPVQHQTGYPPQQPPAQQGGYPSQTQPGTGYPPQPTGYPGYSTYRTQGGPTGVPSAPA